MNSSLMFSEPNFDGQSCLSDIPAWLATFPRSDTSGSLYLKSNKHAQRNNTLSGAAICRRYWLIFRSSSEQLFEADHVGVLVSQNELRVVHPLDIYH